jgi:hypothetical protein
MMPFAAPKVDKKLILQKYLSGEKTQRVTLLFIKQFRILIKRLSYQVLEAARHNIWVVSLAHILTWCTVFLRLLEAERNIFCF